MEEREKIGAGSERQEKGPTVGDWGSGGGRVSAGATGTMMQVQRGRNMRQRDFSQQQNAMVSGCERPSREVGGSRVGTPSS